jgi:hypothetical protein
MDKGSIMQIIYFEQGILLMTPLGAALPSGAPTNKGRLHILAQFIAQSLLSFLRSLNAVNFIENCQ